MRIIVLSVLLVVTLSVSAAPAPFPRTERRAKTDLELLQGEWQFVGRSLGKFIVASKEKYTLHILGDRMTRMWADGNECRLVNMSFKLDPSKTPKHIDVILLERFETNNAPTKPNFKKGGLYRLSGDTLTIHFGTPGGRPADLSSGAELETEVYRRKRR